MKRFRRALLASTRVPHHLLIPAHDEPFEWRGRWRKTWRWRGDRTPVVRVVA